MNEAIGRPQKMKTEISSFRTHLDRNGNHMVSVAFEGARGFAIQTNGNCRYTHRIESGAIIKPSCVGFGLIKDEIWEYVERHGSDRQKELCGFKVFEYPVICNGEVVDFGDSYKEACFIRKETEIAFHGAVVTVGRKRRV